MFALSLNVVHNLHCLVWFPVYHLMHIFSLDCFLALKSLKPYNFLIWIYGFFKNDPQRKVFHNVDLSNFENVLQRSIRRGRSRECIFRTFWGTDFKEFYARSQPWWRLSWVNLFTNLPKKALDISLIILFVLTFSCWTTLQIS